MALGKPGKQKTKHFLTENLTTTDFAKENWSISNALGVNINSGSTFYAFGGYDDSSQSLFKKTLMLDTAKHQWIEVDSVSSPKLKLPRDMAAIGSNTELVERFVSGCGGFFQIQFHFSIQFCNS